VGNPAFIAVADPNYRVGSSGGSGDLPLGHAGFRRFLRTTSSRPDAGQPWQLALRLETPHPDAPPSTK
jgi:hypothetical protein